MRQPSKEKIEKIFDRMARRYDRQMGLFERLMFDGARAWAVSKARGRVIELGVGTGLNLPLYGNSVDSVIGVDLSVGMLNVARKRVADEGLKDVDLHHGDVQVLDVPDESADSVVSTFTVCTIPNPLAASREAYRVLRPGGRFVLAEHGPSTHAIGRAVMRAVEPLSIRFGADHLTRDPVPYAESAGFSVTEVHRGGLGGSASGARPQRRRVGDPRSLGDQHARERQHGPTLAHVICGPWWATHPAPTPGVDGV